MYIPYYVTDGGTKAAAINRVRVRHWESKLCTTHPKAASVRFLISTAWSAVQSVDGTKHALRACHRNTKNRRAIRKFPNVNFENITRCLIRWNAGRSRRTTMAGWDGRSYIRERTHFRKEGKDKHNKKSNKLRGGKNTSAQIHTMSYWSIELRVGWT